METATRTLRLADLPAGAMVNYRGRMFEWAGFPPEDYGHDRCLRYPVNAPLNEDGNFAAVKASMLTLDYASPVALGCGAYLGTWLISDPEWSGWASD